MRGTTLAAMLVLSLAASAARADEVHLEGGRSIEGSVTEQGDKVVIALESGRITVPRTEVARIERRLSPISEVEQREAKLAPTDRAGMLRLADFCRDHDLPGRERALLARILAGDPDHAEARRRLGFVRTEAGWVDRSELAEKRHEASMARRRAELELATKRAELSLAEARAARARDEERAGEKRAEPPRPLEQSAPPPHPHLAFPAYPMPAVVIGAGGRYPHAAPAPAAPPPNYVINGVRDPRSYIDDAQRRPPLAR